MVLGQVQVMGNNDMLEGCSVLLAEDDAPQAIDLFDTLADQGARAVVLVSELDEAVRMAGSHRFDAATLDYRLGGNRATPLADYLDRIGTPFIVHTRYLPELIRRQRLSRSGTEEQHVA